MTIQERFKFLIQGVQVAQSKGVLTLDDAVYVKSAINLVEQNENLELAFKILLKTIETAQSCGCYTLKDSYYLYVAQNGLLEEIINSKEETSEEKPEETGETQD